MRRGGRHGSGTPPGFRVAVMPSPAECGQGPEQERGAWHTQAPLQGTDCFLRQSWCRTGRTPGLNCGAGHSFSAGSPVLVTLALRCSPSFLPQENTSSSTRTAAAPVTGGAGRARASVSTGGRATRCKYTRKRGWVTSRFACSGACEGVRWDLRVAPLFDQQLWWGWRENELCSSEREVPPRCSPSLSLDECRYLAKTLH